MCIRDFKKYLELRNPVKLLFTCISTMMLLELLAGLACRFWDKVLLLYYRRIPFIDYLCFLLQTIFTLTLLETKYSC